MPGRTSHDRGSLQAHDIYLRNYEDLGACSAELRDLFKLIVNIKTLKSDQFGGYEVTGSDHPPVTFTPRQQYEKELKSEAIRLEVVCSDKRRQDDNESKWVQALDPIVFYRFDREQEETLCRDRHQHCFICRKHFPINTRPSISRKSARAIEIRVEKWSDDRDDDFCQLTSTEHFNLPNFDTASQLAYPEFENEGKKIPDLTIGLHSYNLTEWSETDNLLHNDRVRLFDQKLLRELESKKLLVPPFMLPGSSGTRVNDIPLTFPFGFWEAKREGGGYDHQSAQKQNAKKVKMILSWQDQVRKKANVPWVPLVWYFVSIGSKWEIHACHFEQNSIASEGRISVLTTLWSGDSANLDHALQLLYIVDIIALWGEHKYKPFAGACLKRLRAASENAAPPPLEETLLAHQLDINSQNFPWLFPEQQIKSLPPPLAVANSEIISRPRSQNQTTFQGFRFPSLVGETEQLSLAFASPGDYIIPERDPFIWLLDRDIAGQDVLIVRIGEEGSVLPPLVIFDSEDWEERDFRRILAEERARYSSYVSTEFRYRRNGSSYMKSCVSLSPGHFREPRCQFCTIVPLNSRAYEKQLDSIGGTIFGRLESLLGLPELVKAAEKMNDKWCTCRAPYNEYSPSMILCDNLKCPLGWYHKKCQGLHEDFTADHWLCSLCRLNWREIEYGDFQTREIDEDIREASDVRIQWTKTLASVWSTHLWPSQERLIRMINRIACRININERVAFDTVRDASLGLRTGGRCWAIVKDSPKVMLRVKPLGKTASENSTRSAHHLQHRKSDSGLPSLAIGNGIFMPRQAADRFLSVP